MSRKINVNEDFFERDFWRAPTCRHSGRFETSSVATGRDAESGDGSPHSKTMLVQVAAGFVFEQCDCVVEHGRDHGEALADAFG